MGFSILGINGELTAQEREKAKIDFDRDIKPLLSSRCCRCHGAEKQRGGLRLDKRVNVLKGGESGEPAVVPGAGAKSHLVKLISGEIADLTMPPTGKKLSAKEIALLTTWIDQGALWSGGVGGKEEIKLTSDHWSFQPVVREDPPKRKDDWGKNAIDAFVRARLDKAGLQPSPEADRVTLIRRLYLDVLGLPPSPEQVKQFANNKSPDAYEQLVEKVLSSPHYGERWAQHWLDVVRYADTHGFETNTPRPNAWPYRDYVIDSFNKDKPYDQFIREQIAGDSHNMEVAMGFLVAGPQDQVKSPDPVLTAQQRQDELNEIINATSSTFLGLTVSCARCHNHKFDPILQKDYYSLQAIFAGVKYGNRTWTQTNDNKAKQLAQFIKERDSLQQKLLAFEPIAFTGKTKIIDDEDSKHVKVLIPKTGKGTNPAGNGRGQKDYAGEDNRFPNISGGTYSWWDKQYGKEVLAYYPQVSGKFAIWLSWGCGYKTHATDAKYFLDEDGDLQTKQDRTFIATVDQQGFADGTGEIPSRPLWSGLAFPIVQDFKKGSCIVLQAGSKDPATTADVIVLQEVSEIQPPLPLIRKGVNSQRNMEHIEPTPAKYVRFTIEATNNGIEPCIDELEIWSTATGKQSADNVALASKGAKATSSGNYPNNVRHKLEHINDGKYGNGRSWISNQHGKGWVQIELPKTVTIDRLVWGRDREQKYTDRTAVDYRIEVAEQPGKWRVVAGSADRLPYSQKRTGVTYIGRYLPPKQLATVKQIRSRLQKVEAQIQKLTQTKMVFAALTQQPGPTHRLYRGDPMAKREVVAPDTLTLFDSLKLAVDTVEKKRRLELAKWITDKKNPLTARVMVNRIWQHHFGTGIVATPSDFGKMGGRPSHPQLLDWLAAKFMEENWSMKAIHRQILLSKTYRQASIPNPKGMSVDADNRLLWRFPQRRLEGEVIRDSILSVSGVLDKSMGGPGFSLFEPNSNYVRNYIPRKTFGPDGWRRMIYAHKVRMEKDGTFGAFDCPDAGQPTPKRTESTTPIQALNLYNSAFVLRQSELFAERIRKEVGQDKRQQLDRAFLLTMGRRPSEAEAKACIRVTDDHGLTALCRVLYNTNEFLFLP